MLEEAPGRATGYAFDLGNLSFANGRVATGAVAICVGMILRTARTTFDLI